MSLRYPSASPMFRSQDYARYVVLFQGRADWVSGTSKDVGVPSSWGSGRISAAE